MRRSIAAVRPAVAASAISHPRFPVENVMPAWPKTVVRHLRGAAAVVRRGRGEQFDSDGVRIRYFDRGAGEAVVLIHGFTRSAAAWEVSGFAAGLGPDRRIVSFDCRGHGASDKPASPAAYGARMVEDVTRLLDRLGIESAHVVGHSMGGRVALRLAASRPDRVRSAVLIASGGTLAARPGEVDPMPVERVAGSLERGGGLGPLLEAVFPPDRPLSRRRLRLLALAAMIGNDARALAAATRSYAGLTVTDAELASLRPPLLAVVGSRDPYLPAVVALGRRVGGMGLTVVDGATHLDILGRSETQVAVAGFLAARPAAARRAA